jgi:hypothetical protein
LEGVQLGGLLLQALLDPLVLLLQGSVALLLTRLGEAQLNGFSLEVDEFLGHSAVLCHQLGVSSLLLTELSYAMSAEASLRERGEGRK